MENTKTPAVDVELTPNPNALKFIVDKYVRIYDKVTFRSATEAEGVQLAEQLFTLPFVEMVHFFENVVTVTKSDSSSWSDAEPKVKDVIADKIGDHDPEFEVKHMAKNRHDDPDLNKIEEILDRTVRPGLQGDGGDLEVIAKEGNVLTIHYEGACGGCPSATGGTMMAIQGILQDEFDPELEIVAY